jgi:glycosyltransferase
MKISVITVVLNRADTIRTTIESVINQSYDNIEYIIIDGGSTDGTMDIVHSYKDKIDVIISEKDNGIYDAMNKGLSFASGDIVGFLNADDHYANSLVLEKVAEKFKGNNIDAVFGDTVFVDEKNKVIRYWKVGKFKRFKIKLGWMPPHTTFFVKRNIFHQCGGFDSSYSISGDYELAVRLLWKFNIAVSYIPEVLVNCRLGGATNKDIKSLIRSSMEVYRVIKTHKIGGILTLIIRLLSRIPQFVRKR